MIDYLSHLAIINKETKAGKNKAALEAMDTEKEVRQKRMCRKCLTTELDETEYFANLHAYIANLDKDIKVSPSDYEKRLGVCKMCELLADGMCRACGCFVELRAAISKNACPYDKWMALHTENL